MSIQELLDQPLNSWMKGGGEAGDIVFSSRIRMARNIDGIPFPNRASSEQLAEVVERVRDIVNELSGKDDNQSYLFLEMEKLSALERYILVEKHIISPNLAKQPEQRALVASDDVAVSIMVNEEDHLRLQCLTPGLNLPETLLKANQIDDILEQNLDYAFNEQLGYLTSCPTNIGTGLRASVMLHLPALVMTQQINRIVAAATQIGLAVRGLYGEGTEAVGNIFQMSNQLTLGHTEKEIVDNLQAVVQQVVGQEQAARAMLLGRSKDVLADRVWRAYGTLRYARSVSGQEAMSLLSEVRLGVDLEIIDEAEAMAFNELLVTTRPNYLQKLAGGQELEPAVRDQFRAQVIRETLKGEKHHV